MGIITILAITVLFGAVLYYAYNEINSISVH
jgi:cbb3-type cytochrome oxidase subunit 3